MVYPWNWIVRSTHLGHSGNTIAGSLKPTKLPVVGLNDNLEFMGRQLHVQTEHSDVPAARIVTQVFSSGRVLLSKRTEYPQALRDAQDTAGVQQLMHAQHRQVISEIEAKQERLLSAHQGSAKE